MKYFFFIILVFAFVSCKKDPTTPPASRSAKGYLTSLKGGCNPGKAHGIWYDGISTGIDSNYIEVTLNVTQAGSYHIVTDTLSGVSFSSEGTFNSASVYTIKLKASGVFNQWGVKPYTLKFDSSSCNFIVYVQDSSTLSMADNTWEATAYSSFYSGPFGGSLFNLPVGEATRFQASGNSWNGPVNNALIIDLNVDPAVIDTGYYTTDKPGIFFAMSAQDTTKGNPYLLNAHASVDYPGSLVTIHIKSMVPYVTDDVYKTVVSGEFSGNTIDSWHQNRVAPITNGKFKVTF
jgi:hypothetical protein